MIKYCLLTLRKGLILLRLAIFFLPIFLVTLRGYWSTPAIKACPNGLSEVPSSLGLMTTAFRPAYLPLSTSTTKSKINGQSQLKAIELRVILTIYQTNASIVLKISKG